MDNLNIHFFWTHIILYLRFLTFGNSLLQVDNHKMHKILQYISNHDLYGMNSSTLYKIPSFLLGYMYNKHKMVALHMILLFSEMYMVGLCICIQILHSLPPSLLDDFDI